MSRDAVKDRLVGQRVVVSFPGLAYEGYVTKVKRGPYDMTVTFDLGSLTVGPSQAGKPAARKRGRR